MDRSFAAPLARPFGIAGLLRRRSVRPHRPLRLPRGRLRIVAICAALAVPVLGGGWLLLRDSPLVAVQDVRVDGLQGPQSGAIEAALLAAAHRMSTLDVNHAALRSAVAPFPVVREVHASTSLPHGMTLHVLEQPPVATLVAGSVRTAVGADGVVLGPALATSPLPTVQGSYAPAAGQVVRDGTVRAAAAVLGAAPAPLAGTVTRAFNSPYGLAVALRGGLLVYFGDATRPHAKWLALARVLSDPSSSGAAYVDVRLPERAAAGFSPGAGPASGAAGAGSEGSPAGSELPGGQEATIAALASQLTAAGGGTTGTGATSSGSTAPSTTGSETTAGSASSASPEASQSASSGSVNTEASPTHETSEQAPSSERSSQSGG